MSNTRRPQEVEFTINGQGSISIRDIDQKIYLFGHKLGFYPEESQTRGGRKHETLQRQYLLKKHEEHHFQLTVTAKSTSENQLVLTIRSSKLNQLNIPDAFGKTFM